MYQTEYFEEKLKEEIISETPGNHISGRPLLSLFHLRLKLSILSHHLLVGFPDHDDDDGDDDYDDDDNGDDYDDGDLCHPLLHGGQHLLPVPLPALVAFSFSSLSLLSPSLSCCGCQHCHCQNDIKRH